MTALADRYRLHSFIIQGEVMRPFLAEFVFSRDGTYLSGGVQGLWEADGDLVRLSSRFASWGSGKLSDQGRLLMFEYEEGGVQFVVILSRVDEKKPR